MIPTLEQNDSEWIGPSIMTSRQREILDLLSQGYTAKEIGSSLFISHHTVVSHCIRLKEKLKAKNCTHLIAIALRIGII